MPHHFAYQPTTSVDVSRDPYRLGRQKLPFERFASFGTVTLGDGDRLKRHGAVSLDFPGAGGTSPRKLADYPFEKPEQKTTKKEPRVKAPSTGIRPVKVLL